MAKYTNSPKPVHVAGPQHKELYVRWAPSGDTTQTLTESSGISSVTRSNAGIYTVNLSEAPVAICEATISYIENDTTNYHFAEVTAISAANKTVSVRHRTCTFANVASAPTASDTVDQLVVKILVRTAK